MDIIITKHAKERMLERSISIEELQNAIDLPDYTIAKDNLIEVYKKIKNRNLKIVYSKEGKFIKIITVIDKS